MNLVDLIKYNSRILISKTYVVFLLATLIIPTALQLSNAMYFEMIVPLCGIFIFANMMFYEKNNKINKNFYMTKLRKKHIFLLRIFLNIIFYILISGLFYFYITCIVKNTFEDISITVGPLNTIVMIFIGLINYLLFGLISLTIAHISKKPLLGIITSALYGIFWMVNYYDFSTSILNPFTYSASNEYYLIYKLIACLIIIVLTILNFKIIESKFYND